VEEEAGPLRFVAAKYKILLQDFKFHSLFVNFLFLQLILMNLCNEIF